MTSIMCRYLCWFMGWSSRKVKSMVFEYEICLIRCVFNYQRLKCALPLKSKKQCNVIQELESLCYCLFFVASGQHGMAELSMEYIVELPSIHVYQNPIFAIFVSVGTNSRV